MIAEICLTIVMALAVAVVLYKAYSYFEKKRMLTDISGKIQKQDKVFINDGKVVKDELFGMGTREKKITPGPVPNPSKLGLEKNKPKKKKGPTKKIARKKKVVSKKKEKKK